VLASLLPGIRELRAPLAAGFIWVAFFYLVLGSPVRADAPGPIQELLELSDSFGTALTGVAVSFIAYLIGSLSQDFFGQVLPVGVARLSRLLASRRDFMRMDVAERLVELSRRLHEIERMRLRLEESGEGGPPQEYYDLQTNTSLFLGETIDLLRGASLAGASQTEKPEALRPMLEAEEDLRLSIVPPLVALFTYFVVSDGIIWLLGVVFTVALYAQAAARHAQARVLARQARTVREFSETLTQLRKVERAFIEGNLELARHEFNEIDLRALRHAER